MPAQQGGQGRDQDGTDQQRVQQHATAAIDRLERAGHLRRTRESTDRRVVHLRYGEPGMALAVAFFGPLGARSDAVMAQFSTAELATVERFLDGMTEAVTAHRDEVRGQS